MRISTKCSVALHCLIFISEYGEKEKVTSELLAKSTGCNPVVIRNILNPLQKAGLITIARGVGGAVLRRAPSEITIWDVYHHLEPDCLETLFGFHPNPLLDCPIGREIENVLKEPYDEIGNSVKDAMEKVTLQHLLDRYHEICTTDTICHEP